MLDDLIVGIKSRYDSTAGVTLRGLLKGGLWYPQAKQDVIFPYIVINDVSDIDYSTFGTEIEFIHLQFAILHNNLNVLATGGIQAIDNAVKALYHNVNLTVSGGVNFSSRWTGRRNIPIQEKIFFRVMEFEFYVEKT